MHPNEKRSVLLKTIDNMYTLRTYNISGTNIEVRINNIVFDENSGNMQIYTSSNNDKNRSMYKHKK